MIHGRNDEQGMIGLEDTKTGKFTNAGLVVWAISYVMAREMKMRNTQF